MTTLLSAADGVENANHTVSVIGARLSDTQTNVVELRNKIASLALVAAIDPDHQGELIEARARLAASEASMRELGAAQKLAADMAREASGKALLARRDSDWASAADLLDEALTTARALDSVLRSAGDLYSQLQRLTAEAAARVGRHLNRPEYAVPLPDLETPLKLVLSNNGGPQAGPTLHLDAAERARASIAHVIEIHSRQVMTHRPASPTKQEETSHG